MAALAGEVADQWYDDRGVSGLRTACSTVSKEILPSITGRPSPASAASNPVRCCSRLRRSKDSPEAPLPNNPEDLQDEVLSLSPSDRSRLPDRRVASLDVDTKVEAARDAVADQREQELNSGTAEAVPAEFAVDRLEARFPGWRSRFTRQPNMSHRAIAEDGADLKGWSRRSSMFLVGHRLPFDGPDLTSPSAANGSRHTGEARRPFATATPRPST